MASASALAKAFGLSAGSPASAPVHVRDHAPDGVFAEPPALCITCIACILQPVSVIAVHQDDESYSESVFSMI